MALSPLIESLMSLSRPNSLEPRSLVEHVAVEYLYPIVPPFTETYFTLRLGGFQVTGSGRASNEFARIFYRMRFGHIVPGVFRLTILLNGVESYKGTIQGQQLEEGIDYLYFQTPEKTASWYLANLTNMNQTFEMVNQYLTVGTPEDWETVKKYMKMINFPYKFPEERK